MFNFVGIINKQQRKTRNKMYETSEIDVPGSRVGLMYNCMQANNCNYAYRITRFSGATGLPSFSDEFWG